VAAATTASAASGSGGICNYYHGAQAMAEQASVSGLTEQQAKEFHEQFKITYTAFVGIAALVHLFVIATKPWF
jgi:light-harvesting complex 1 beta chain